MVRKRRANDMERTSLPRRNARRAGAPALAAFAVMLAWAGAAAAQADFDTAAPYAAVIDAETRTTLLAKNADTPVPPASMSKLMTAELVFAQLASGGLAMTDQFPVSDNAFRKEGSKMFLNLGDAPAVSDLLRGLIVQSGNDAAIVLAEGISGSEEAFAQRMNERAAELGLTNSHFANATGLPNPEHKMSVRDLALLALHIIQTYPQYYKIYSEKSFTWAGVEQKNRNPLIYLDDGGDGLKTGYTDEAGYGIVGSAQRDGRRVVAVLSGLESDDARRFQIRRVIGWAFRSFETVTLAEAGAPIGEAAVWLGEKEQVKLALTEPLIATLPRGAKDGTKATIVYDGPVRAPIKQGDPIGALRVELSGETIERPLVAAEDVGAGGYGVRLSAGFGYLLRLAGLSGGGA